MTGQGLFDFEAVAAPAVDPEPVAEEKPSLAEQFEAFDRSHPDVYALFTQFASELREAGRESYGAKSIMERIRWHYATSSRGETFKINNNYTSRYARKLIHERPEFDGFFETRRLTSGED